MSIIFYSRLTAWALSQLFYSILRMDRNRQDRQLRSWYILLALFWVALTCGRWTLYNTQPWGHPEKGHSQFGTPKFCTHNFSLYNYSSNFFTVIINNIIISLLMLVKNCELAPILYGTASFGHSSVIFSPILNIFIFICLCLGDEKLSIEQLINFGLKIKMPNFLPKKFAKSCPKDGVFQLIYI